MQALPIAAVLLTRRRETPQRPVRLVLAAAGSYFTLFALLLAQALNGQSITAPSPVFVAAFALWAVATTIAVGVAMRSQTTTSQSMVVLA